MNEEQIKVLTMLAEHKINAQQAQMLLDGLEGDASGARHDEFGRGQGHSGRPGAAVREEGDRVAEPEQGFTMPPDSSLAVTVTACDLRVAPQKEGQSASVRSSGRRSASVWRTGHGYRVQAGPRAGHVDVLVPQIRELQAKVTGGSVNVEGMEADISARVRGGSFSARDCTGTFSGDCAGGSADMAGLIKGIKVDSKGASLTLRALQIAEGHHFVKNLGGSVVLVLSRTASLRIKVSSLAGQVASELPPERESGDRIRQSIEYRLNDGAASLDIENRGGTVDIRVAS